MKAPYPSLVVFLRIWTLLFPRASPTFAPRATEYGNGAGKSLFILKSQLHYFYEPDPSATIDPSFFLIILVSPRTSHHELFGPGQTEF